jgi:hypothetical protein
MLAGCLLARALQPLLHATSWLNVIMDIEQKARELRNDGYVEGELSIDPLWYIIWEPEDIAEYNKDYQLAKDAPGFVAFGSTGGGELLVLNAEGAVFTLPAIGMEPQYARKIAENIEDLRQYMERNF